MKSIYRNKYLAFIFTISLLTNLSSQNKKDNIWADDNFTGLQFRSIGPALMSGRISDIAVHPEDDNIWYLTVGSGGVWKTTNAGVTWTPIFDDQGSYSIGCVTIDPNNPHIVWIGTGEDLGGRHFGYGDGVYRSDDGGKTWKNMGLKNSEHVSKILIHPENSNVVWVASQGPLWSKGGDRGVYKSTDGGENWTNVWSDNEWTGATELVMDPRNQTGFILQVGSGIEILLPIWVVGQVLEFIAVMMAVKLGKNYLAVFRSQIWEKLDWIYPGIIQTYFMPLLN